MENSNSTENIPLESEVILPDNNSADEKKKLLNDGLTVDTSNSSFSSAPTITETTPTPETKYASELPSPRRIPRQTLLHFDTNDNIHQLERELEQRQSAIHAPAYDMEDNAIPSTIGGSLDKIIGTFIRGIGHITKDPELVSSGEARIRIGTAEIEQKKRERLEAANEATVATP
jgi:hypothetical protein